MGKYQFKQADVQKTFVRMTIGGGAGVGKTYTSLKLASILAQKLEAIDGRPRRIGAIDSEQNSMPLYADEFSFAHVVLEKQSIADYIEAIHEAWREGFDILIIDSISHAWAGEGGALELMHNVSKKFGGNTYFAFGEITPLQNKFIATINNSPMHVFLTLRGKDEYVIETNDRGKQVPKKVGMGFVQRNDIEFEFHVNAIMDIDHNFDVTKARIRTLEKFHCQNPGEDVVDRILAWYGNTLPTVKESVDDIIKRVDEMTDDPAPTPLNPAMSPIAVNAAPPKPMSAEHALDIKNKARTSGIDLKVFGANLKRIFGTAKVDELYDSAYEPALEIISKLAVVEEVEKTFGNK